MAGRGMDEARAGVVGDMVAVEQGHVEVIARVVASGWAQVMPCEFASAGTSRDALERLDLGRFESRSSASLSAST